MAQTPGPRRRQMALPEGVHASDGRDRGSTMRHDDRSDRSERGARVLLFLALCGAVFWALTSGHA